MTARPRRVVIVAYGAAHLLAQTLATLDGSERVVVVDNSSSPQVRAITVSANAEYVDPGRNLGFAAGVNLALRGLGDADSDVLLLNPDATITSAQIDVLQEFLARQGNEDVAAVSPALTSPDGTPQRVCWPFPSPAGMWRESFGLARLATDWRGFVVGAVLLLRREALAAVGEFDERFFLYAEETDWQQRAAELGWRSAVLDEVIALHVGAGTSVDSVQRLALFHAAQETYIRRWFGPLGWLSYRLAVLLGALLRTVLATGPKRRHHWARAHLYLAGPRRRAALPSHPMTLRVTHVVVTPNAAGTERYVCQVATLQAAAGHHVTVIGGDPTYMRSALPSTAVWRPGETPRRAWQALRTGGSQDLVHAHLSAADFVAVAAVPCHGAKVISTRHIGKTRGGSFPIRLMFRVLQRRINIDICMSEQVGRAVGGRATVLPAGVRRDARLASAGSRVVVMAQRLEPEKASDVALAGWAESGLAAQGWTLVICGDGSQREQLQHLAARSGIRGVRWRGWDEDLRSTLLQAAALLAPCPVESYGLAVVEAMSVGLPVVAAAGGGHLETVGRCPESLLFAPGDVQDCARQLAALAAMTPTALAGYGAALQQLQRSRFDIADHVARLDDVYRSALDRGPVG